MSPVTIGALGLVEFGEGAAINELLTQAFVLFGRAVTPVDVVWLHDCSPFSDPLLQTFVVA